MKHWTGLVLLGWLIAGCSSSQKAPVIDRLPVQEPVNNNRKVVTPEFPTDNWVQYTVKKGDTLIGIALDHGLEYKDIAAWNNIPSPTYLIQTGQILKLKLPVASQVSALTPQSTPAKSGEPVITPLNAQKVPEAKVVNNSSLARAPVKESGAEKPAANNQPTANKKPRPDTAPGSSETASKPDTSRTENVKPENIKSDNAVTKPSENTKSAEVKAAMATEWSWPSKGKVISQYNEAASKKGISITGTEGQPVYTAAPGKVIYSGSSLKGYGNLLIIKHDAVYSSVYAHNSQLLVKEGQIVTRGQQIAEMGHVDTDSVKLYFEIRKLGKAVNPMEFLPAN